jgi:hypothetical protein
MFGLFEKMFKCVLSVSYLSGRECMFVWYDESVFLGNFVSNFGCVMLCSAWSCSALGGLLCVVSSFGSSFCSSSLFSCSRSSSV